MDNNTNKIIHYCWFGGAPLSDLTKKCIETWKKFLPEFEIKEWNENNFDVNQCTFVKEAYEQKKWAFVADYTRFKVLEEYGGIYLDTDMEITSDISKYLEEELFLGQEDSKMVNAAVVWVKEKNNKHIKNIVKFYEDLKEFNPTGDLYDMSVPRVLTNYFEKYDLDIEKEEIQKLDNGSATIYPMEYFYPLSYDYQHNKFTDNSCMIHHFDATWISKMEKFKTKMKRKNMTWVVYVIDFFVSLKNKIKFFCNYRDVSIFFTSFLIMLFATLSITPVNSITQEQSIFNNLAELSSKSILQITIFSFIWTFICAKIRMIDVNKFGDKLLGRDPDSEDYKPFKLNVEDKKRFDKVEFIIFISQLILTIIISFIPVIQLAVIIPNSFELFVTFVMINSYLLYCGIKRKFKYRILELIPYALILSLIHMIYPSIGMLLSVFTFAVVMINLIKYKVKSKRIKVFGISYAIFMICATILSLTVIKSFDDINFGTNLIKNESFNNYADYLAEHNVVTEFNAAKIIFANNIKNLVNVNILFNPTIYVIISFLISIVYSIIKKNYRYIFLGVLAIFNVIYVMGINIEVMFVTCTLTLALEVLYLLELILDNILNVK